MVTWFTATLAQRLRPDCREVYIIPEEQEEHELAPLATERYSISTQTIQSAQ